MGERGRCCALLCMGHSCSIFCIIGCSRVQVFVQPCLITTCAGVDYFLFKGSLPSGLRRANGRQCHSRGVMKTKIKTGSRTSPKLPAAASCDFCRARQLARSHDSTRGAQRINEKYTQICRPFIYVICVPNHRHEQQENQHKSWTTNIDLASTCKPRSALKNMADVDTTDVDTTRYPSTVYKAHRRDADIIRKK